jgi:hypothetical protein
MKSRRRSINAIVILAIILGQLALASVGLAQESPAGVCVPDPTPDESGADALTGMVREESGITPFLTDADVNIVAGWSLICVEAGTAANTLSQEGQILLNVLEGSITLKLTKLCGAEGCVTTGGEMRTGEPDASGVIVWSPVSIGSSYVLSSPNLVALSDVTVDITFGSVRTRFLSSGWSPLFPGGGCLAACWRFP